jgi:hypothetical protein
MSLSFLASLPFIFFVTKQNSSLFLTLYPLSGVDTKCLSSCDKDSQIIFTPGRLTSNLLETAMSANKCKCKTNGLTRLSKYGEARDNNFWSPIR